MKMNTLMGAVVAVAVALMCTSIASAYDYSTGGYDLSKNQLNTNVYMELAKDTAQVGVNDEGKALYEYVLNYWAWANNGSQVQFVYGFDNSQIASLYDISVATGVYQTTPGDYLPTHNIYEWQTGLDWTRVPMQFIGQNAEYPCATAEDLYGNWTATAHPWGVNISAATMLPEYYTTGYQKLVPGPAIDAGQTWQWSYGGGVATEDMLYVPNQSGWWGHNTGLHWTMRIVTTQSLVDGDLMWSLEFGQTQAPVLGRFLPPLTPGDFNGIDGVNDIDIDLLGDFIRNGLDYDSLYDISADGLTGGQDGFIDIKDLDYLIRFLVETSLGTGTEYGDFNLDGLVDTTDLTRLATNYGDGNWNWDDGNANRNLDTNIDTTDLTILATYYGFEATPDAIPEPMTLSLLALGGLGMLRRRRK